MSPLESIAVWVTAVVLTISGLISNGFIVTTTIIEWTKFKSLSSSELLFLSLSLSNFVVGVLLFPFSMDDFIIFSFKQSTTLKILFPVAVFAILSRFWLTAWLCVFYCIKIVNSTHSLFLWCKLRISWLIPRLIAGSLLISFFASLGALEMYPIHCQGNATIFRTLSQGKTLRASDFRFQLFFIIFGTCSPLLTVLLCSTLVVASLSRHICQMTGKEHFRDFQRKAHIKATGTVLSLLLVYLSFFAVQIWSVTLDPTYTEKLFISAVMMAYAPVQATILVLSNPKLKQVLTVMVRRTKP
ncbi:taste receptor type 2 member 40-like [Anolis sagrei]|uniref:taste receptor type 2 member 40-like n=1 Tax=Anolis sagrei TaxID=38937 RepID=UPI0035213CA8